MRYWLDTEFIEDGRTIDLISIGIVAEDGRELELFNLSCRFNRASVWVRENVLKHLPEILAMGASMRPENLRGFPDVLQEDARWLSHEHIRNEVCTFICGHDDRRTELWAYYGGYDWVVFCQLFGKMVDLPREVPKHLMDIKQLAVSMGDPRLPKKPKDKHSALVDARWTKQAWEYLRMLKETG